jgi:MFS superfamily sulfate permease-like transporter
MMHPFYDLAVGDVFLAPFISYAMAACGIFLLTRSILRLCRFGELFSHPAIAELSLYVTILGVLTVAF